MVILGNTISLLLPILLPGLVFIAAIKLNWFPALNTPIDGGLTIAGKRIFGQNKTWRGVVFYTVGAAIICEALHLLQPQQAWIAPVFANNPVILGPLWGLFYSVGELINSFVKRSLGIGEGAEPKSRLGKSIQAAADNADGALFSGILLVLFGVPLLVLLTTLVVSVGTHASTDVLMRRLRLKNRGKA